MHGKNTKFIVIRHVLSSYKGSKTCFRLWFTPDPAGELTTLPQTVSPPSRLGKRHPSSQPSSLAVFGVSNLDLLIRLFCYGGGGRMIFLQGVARNLKLRHCYA